MDMSDFDVILGMDKLTHRVVIDYDCHRKRVTTYTLNGNCVTFQGDKHDALPRAVYDSKWHGRLAGWLSSLTLKDEVRQVRRLSGIRDCLGFKDCPGLETVQGRRLSTVVDCPRSETVQDH